MIDPATLLMEFLQRHARGRAHAKTRDEAQLFLRQRGVQLSDRALRALYCKLPLCSCDEGLFIPTRPEDVAEFQRYLKAKALPLLERYKVIAAYYPELVPARGEQMELF